MPTEQRSFFFPPLLRRNARSQSVQVLLLPPFQIWFRHHLFLVAGSWLPPRSKTFQMGWSADSQILVQQTKVRESSVTHPGVSSSGLKWRNSSFFLVFGWCNCYICQSWQRKVLNNVSLIGNVMWRRAFRHGRLTRFEAVNGLHKANSAGHILSMEDRGSHRLGKKPRVCVHGLMVLNLNAMRNKIQHLRKHWYLNHTLSVYPEKCLSRHFDMWSNMTQLARPRPFAWILRSHVNPLLAFQLFLQIFHLPKTTCMECYQELPSGIQPVLH